MVLMVPPGKKSPPVDVLPVNVDVMTRRKWKLVSPAATEEKVTDNGES